MSGFTKPEHREFAQDALTAYREAHPDYRDNDNEPDDQAISDLICGLLMLAKDLGYSPEKVIQVAQIHYEEEG